ncbi:hypothetical protein [Kamptonema formosum]|uniref:hypothetical protein n=1 Tax=Kamptonema formosum TaxID=331992 RepID=UPI000348E57E|nr:hypothetical protein [Oscillatoria sp. PCC 10802]
MKLAAAGNGANPLKILRHCPPHWGIGGFRRLAAADEFLPTGDAATDNSAQT